MNNILKSEKSYVYELKHEYVTINKKYLVKGNISVDNIRKLIFYIQYKYHEIMPDEILTQREIQNILVKCYGFKIVSDIQVNETIELYSNFKKYFQKEEIHNIINNDKIYEISGLTARLREIVYLTVERWR
ncbi:hypothetical protein FDB29_08165 [Clostridium botulinum]|nr:hypothetical protein [Clostridium botulinum]